MGALLWALFQEADENRLVLDVWDAFVSLQLEKLALWRSPEYDTGEKKYVHMKDKNKTTNQSGKAVPV